MEEKNKRGAPTVEKHIEHLKGYMSAEKIAQSTEMLLETDYAVIMLAYKSIPKCVFTYCSRFATSIDQPRCREHIKIKCPRETSLERLDRKMEDLIVEREEEAVAAC